MMKKAECKYLIKNSISFEIGPFGSEQKETQAYCSLKKDKTGINMKEAVPMNEEYKRKTGKQVAPHGGCPYFHN